MQPFLIDTHCHLDLEQYDVDREQVIERARDAGVALIVNPGIDVGHSQRAIELAERFANVYAAVGVHPNSSEDVDAETITQLRELAAHPKVVAIGEIGLDFYWERVEQAQQRHALDLQLELAQDLGLPVIIHSRNAKQPVPGEASCYDVLADVLGTWVHSHSFRQSRLAERPFAGVLHAFGGDLTLARAAYDWRFVLSLGGPVTFKNARQLHALVPQLRLDRLMLETDGPYLSPDPHRGQRNEPSRVALVCERIAELCNTNAAQVAAVTTETALRFFDLKDAPHVERTAHSQKQSLPLDA